MRLNAWMNEWVLEWMSAWMNEHKKWMHGQINLLSQGFVASLGDFCDCLRKESKRKEFKACRKCKNDPTLAHSFYYCSQECQGML